MRFPKCCGTRSEVNGSDHEVVRIEKTKNSCRLCEEYAERQAAKPVAVLSCEGACLRGEISRQAANILCHELMPEQTARICLGGAFTKDTGQRNLVRKARRVVALEGCHINCASRMMQGVLGEPDLEVIVTNRLCDFDRKLFGVNEMPPAEIAGLARSVAERVAPLLRKPAECAMPQD